MVGIELGDAESFQVGLEGDRVRRCRILTTYLFSKFCKQDGKLDNRSLLLLIVTLICDRTWEKGPLRAKYDFSVQAYLVYLT